MRRRQPARATFVRDVLEHLYRCGWPGTPRYLGIDAGGRQVLSFVDGNAAWRPADQARVRSPGSLAAVAGLARQFHDLTAGTDLAGGAEVVCHNDLSPKNTVYRDTGAGAGHREGPTAHLFGGELAAFLSR